MAFVSKDWRDPGCEYVKSKNGVWELKKLQRLRIFELLGENCVKRAYRQSISESGNCNPVQELLYDKNNKSMGFYQPYVVIKTFSTKESKIITTLSEALLLLDFNVAIKDIRRFGYVCRIINILIVNKLPNLSGRTQMYILNLLKDILKQVCETQNNTEFMRKLLDNLTETLESNKFNHVGSFQLWKNHLDSVEEMKCSLKGLEIKTDAESDSPNLHDLPPECLIKILQNLTSPHDLQMVSEASFTLQNLVDDELLWKQLVVYHFTREQMSSICPKRELHSLDDCNWRYLYTRLLKRYGDRHFFPIKLAKCLVCSSVYWPIFGHPCNDEKDNFVLLSPEEFVNIFQI